MDGTYTSGITGEEYSDQETHPEMTNDHKEEIRKIVSLGGLDDYTECEFSAEQQRRMKHIIMEVREHKDPDRIILELASMNIKINKKQVLFLKMMDETTEGELVRLRKIRNKEPRITNCTTFPLKVVIQNSDDDSLEQVTLAVPKIVSLSFKFRSIQEQTHISQATIAPNSSLTNVCPTDCCFIHFYIQLCGNYVHVMSRKWRSKKSCFFLPKHVIALATELRNQANYWEQESVMVRSGPAPIPDEVNLSVTVSEVDQVYLMERIRAQMRLEREQQNALTF